MKYKPVTFGADAMVQYISGFSQIYSMYSTVCTVCAQQAYVLLYTVNVQLHTYNLDLYAVI